MRAIILVSVLLMAAVAASAEAAVDLYVGEVTVADQGGAERSRALPLALEQVFRKLSGVREFDDYPLVRPALDRASETVLSYHYRKVTGVLPDGGEAEELRLVARFAETAVDDLVRASQLPLWPPERSPLLVWQIVDDGLDRRIMPVEFEYTRQSMADVAEQRGLELAWPSPDEEGTYAVDDQILWGGYTEDLAAAQGDGVLIAGARREGPEWGVRMNLGYKGQHWTWRLNGLDLQATLIDGMHQVVDQIAAVGMIAASDLGSWQQELTVGGLRGPDDYLRCLNYLQNISVVEGIDVLSARSGMVVFRLALSAMPRHLEEALDGGGVLERPEGENTYLLIEATPDDS